MRAVRSTRLRVGLFGLLFHAIVIAGALGIAATNRAPMHARFWAVAAPALLVAAFAMYAVVVAPYVARRAAKRGVAFLDAAIGMAVEPAIVILATVLFSAISAGPALRDGAAAFAATLGGHVHLGLLWLAANFMTQILVIGNAAGFVGFLVLKRLAERAARA